MPKLLTDDMPLTSALSYVLDQYDAPQLLTDHILTIADNWTSRKDAPNYGVAEHPEGYDGWCVCSECLRESAT